MKYIRTENGIYKVTATAETNKIYEYGNCYQIYDHNNCIRKDILIKDIIKQANEIEELCDEILLKHYAEDNSFVHYRYGVSCLGLAKRDAEQFSPKKYEIYGAIWTSKGLIYVAKMNEKGELELI